MNRIFMAVGLLLAGCVSQPVAPPTATNKSPTAAVTVNRTITIPAAMMPPKVAIPPMRMTASIILPPPPARTNLLLSWDYGTNYSQMSEIFATWDLGAPFTLIVNVVGTNFATTVSSAKSEFFRVGPIAAVQLAWNPSISTNVTNYKIYWGSASGQYSNQIEVGNVTNAVVPGLAYGATYYLAATAEDAAGVESPFSNEVVWVTPTNAPEPQNFRLTVQ